MKHPKFIFIVLVFVVFLLFVSIIACNKYGTNNVLAMIKLSFTSETVVQTFEYDNYTSYLIKLDHGQAYDRLKTMMETKGWKFVEQMGAGYIFMKDQQRTIVST